MSALITTQNVLYSQITCLNIITSIYLFFRLFHFIRTRPPDTFFQVCQLFKFYGNSLQVRNERRVAYQNFLLL